MRRTIIGICQCRAFTGAWIEIFYFAIIIWVAPLRAWIEIISGDTVMSAYVSRLTARGLKSEIMDIQENAGSRAFTGAWIEICYCERKNLCKNVAPLRA